MGVVLITGGTRGIGKETAKLFLEKGHKVVICYKDSDKTAQSLEKLGILTCKCDITNKQQVCDMIDKIHLRYGKISVLVNNAGIALKPQPFFDAKEEDFLNAFNTNVLGTFLVTQKVVLDMISQKSGAIVNVSSIWGIEGGSCEAIYSMTKGAIIALTKSLSKELSDANIRVNAVAPGIIDTDMNSHLSDSEKSEFLDGYAIKRMGKAQEVASVVYFLASSDASYINGEVIKIDGGKL